MATAQRAVRSEDSISLATAVVSIHDALDNLAGAVASEKSIHLGKDPTFIQTFLKIAHHDGFAVDLQKVEELNALRNNVKHRGMEPNPRSVRSLLPLMLTFADDLCLRTFGRALAEIHLVDAVEDESLRNRFRHIQERIESGEYRNALGAMSFALFEMYEREILEFQRRLAFFGGAAPTGKFEFPQIDANRVRLDFLELGLDPEEYFRFHQLVPYVGLARGTDSGFIKRKSRATWHDGNWTRENCITFIDFLLRLAIAKQRRATGPKLSLRYEVDRITVLRDTPLLHPSNDDVVRPLRAGDILYAVNVPFVERAWQNPNETTFISNFEINDSMVSGRITKADIQFEPGVRSLTENWWLSSPTLAPAASITAGDETQRDRDS